MPTNPGMTVIITRNHAMRTRPTWSSSREPKYHRIAIEMSTLRIRRSRPLASGHVISRHTSPEVTSSGMSANLTMIGLSGRSSAQTNTDTRHINASSAAEPMSSVPTRNQGSFGPRLLGFE